MRTLLKWLGILLALLIVVVGTLLIVFDWSWLKGPIEDYVRDPMVPRHAYRDGSGKAS
jgi:hypothetical protein